MIGTLVLSWLAFRDLGAQITEFNDVSAPSLSKSIHLLGIANSFHQTGPTLAGAPTTRDRQINYARMVDHLNRMSNLSLAQKKEGLNKEDRHRISALIERLKTSLTLLNSSAKYRIRLLQIGADERIQFYQDYLHLQNLIANLSETRIGAGVDIVLFDRLASQFHTQLTNWKSVQTKSQFQTRVEELGNIEKDLTDKAARLPDYIIRATKRVTAHLAAKDNLFSLRTRQFEVESNTNRELEKVKVKITQIRLILSLNVKRTELAIEQAAMDARRLIQTRTAQLAAAVFVVVLLAFFASLVFVRRSLVRRLTALGSSMQQIAEGKLNAEINTKGRDEIARMAKALVVFRNTAREVEEQQTRAIIESSVAGLVMTNEKGTIEFLSFTARQLFGYDPVDMPSNAAQPVYGICPCFVVHVPPIVR